MKTERVLLYLILAGVLLLIHMFLKAKADLKKSKIIDWLT